MTDQRDGETQTALLDVVPRTVDLEARATDLRKILNTPTERDRAAAELAEVERQLASQREREAIVEAERRKLATRRAHGSHAATLDQLLARREAVVREVDALTQRANESYEKAVECERLVGRGVLPAVIAPGRRANVTLVPSTALADYPRRRF